MSDTVNGELDLNQEEEDFVSLKLLAPRDAENDLSKEHLSKGEVRDEGSSNKAGIDGVLEEGEPQCQEIVVQEEGNDLTLMLPTEIWVQILGGMTIKKEVVQLRLVSNRLKSIVDEFQHFAVRIDGRNKTTIPGPHVKIIKLEIRNFFVPLSETQGLETFHGLEKVQKLLTKGPIHTSVVQRVIDGAINLKVMEMNSLSFEIEGPIPSVEHLKKLETVIFYHPDSCDFKEEDGEEFYKHFFLKDEPKNMNCFALTIFNMLKMPIKLPVLTKLSIEYDELPVNLIYDLCETTIIPFINAHAETLTFLQIKLRSDIYEDLFDEMFGDDDDVLPEDDDGVQDNDGGVIENDGDEDGDGDVVGDDDDDAVQDDENKVYLDRVRGTTRLTKLVELCLCLPDASLNRVLKSIFNKDSIPINTLKQCIIEWGAPILQTHDDEAWEIIHSILRNNSESLLHIVLENVDGDNCLLFDFATDNVNEPFVIFKSLTDLQISARIQGYEDALAIPASIIQSKLVVQQFPNLADIILFNIGIELRALQNWLMGSCPVLEHLELDELDYDNFVMIDEEFLRTLMGKSGLKTIKIEVGDLTTLWDQPYWNNIKAIPVVSAQVDTKNFLVIRLHQT